MKFIYLIIVFIVSLSIVSTQDLPPVFDLPPPPPFDTPVADTGNEKPPSENSTIVDETVINDTSVAKDTLNETAVAEKVPLDKSAAINNSVNATAETTSEVNVTVDENNQIRNENVTTEPNLSDVLSDISSVISDKNETLARNVTDSAAIDTIIADETTLTGNLSNRTENVTNTLDENIPYDASNGTNLLPDPIIDQAVLNDNSSSVDTFNVTTDEVLPPIDNTGGLDSLTFSLDGIIDVNNMDSVPSAIDLPPPPLDFDPLLDSGFDVSDVGNNMSDTFSTFDTNTTLATDINDTSSGNKTYIDQVDIYIEPDTGNVTMTHTPVEVIGPDFVVDTAVDVPPVPIPIDLPPPPVDKPSVDFVETQGSTTIEISDLMAGIGAFDKSSPPMNIAVSDTTTSGMAQIYPDVSGLETTTMTPIDMFTSPLPFMDYITTTFQPGIMEPAEKQHITETGEQLPSMDHPPPIFTGGSQSSIYTDPYGPRDNVYQFPETTTITVKPITKEVPPPPIEVPSRPDRRTNWPRQIATTISPYLPKSTNTGLHPRHMNVAELAAYALRMTNQQQKFSNEPSQGVHVFFPSMQETTTTQKPTTAKPTYRPKDSSQQKDVRSNAFIEYLRKRYGISNIGTTPAYDTLVQNPAINQLQNTGGQKKFYDAQYLLSHLPEATTQKPTMKQQFDTNYLRSHLDIGHAKPVSQSLYMTTMKPTTTPRHFFDSNYLLSHLTELQPTKPLVKPKPKLPPTPPMTSLSYLLPQKTIPQNQNNAKSSLQSWMNNMNVKPGAISRISSEQLSGTSVLKEQRQGQVDTRPIDLKPNIQPQSIINYNVNPKSTRPFTGLTTANFKPVVYGNKPVQMATTSSGLSLRERFNRKWYHPEQKTPAVTETAQPIRNINVRIDEPVNNRQIITEPLSPVSVLLSNVNAGSNINAALKNTVSNRDISIQRSSIELQRELIKQQEEKLRRQQQQLQEQQAILNLQRQQSNRQVSTNVLPHTSEQERLHLLRLQQTQNRNFLFQQQQRKEEEERLRLLKQQKEEQQKKQQKEQARLLLLQQQQEQQQRNQQLLLKQREQERLLQEQNNQRELLLNQQARERLLQQQLQLERQREQELLRRQQSNQFPLASRLGHSEVLQSQVINNRQNHYTYKPDVQLSSIEIFKAPAMLRRRKNRERKESVPQTSQTHWQAPTDLRYLHGHLSVPYKINPPPEVQTTQATPAPTIYVATTQAPMMYIQTMQTTTMKPIMSSTQPTLPVTADPNPPPIFDTKVRHTFMPMPKIDPTTRAPRSAANVSGWAGGQGDNTQSNMHMDERCRGCVFVNDRCLLPDPVHCHFYIECVKQGSSARAFSRECALGSFFDRRSFLCVDPKNADCPTDRCRIPGTKWYAIHGHCKHYWSCGAREGGGVFAQSECCPEMGGFVEPVGCVENPNCTDTCSSTIMKDGPTDLSNCSCSNDPTCPCDGAKQATAKANSCLPMLSLTFDGGKMEDKSNTKQHVGVEGISATREGEAIYNGGGRLVLWRYSNLMFPIVYAIRFRFYSTTPSPRKQIIFSNCNTKGGQEPSVEIALDTVFNEVIFKIDTYEGPSKRFTIIYQPSKWTNVDFIYDGERIVGSVDRRARNIFAGGGIETRPHPMGIGSCNGKDGFKGLLDDVSIYEECIPDDMYGIFMSVLE